MQHTQRRIAGTLITSTSPDTPSRSWIPLGNSDVLVGNNLKAVRTALGMSLVELADAAHMAVADLTAGEHGAYRFTARDLLHLTQALGVGPSSLFRTSH